MTIYYDVIILGAGASGLTAAIEAAEKGCTVLVVDHAQAVGKKILISGGGKCNVTNRTISYKDYYGNNPAFCKNLLNKYRIENVLQILKHAEIEIEEREYGRIFCRQSAKQLVGYLETKAQNLGVTFLLETEIVNVEKQDDAFLVSTSKGIFSAYNLIVSTGGLAYPQTGATDIGHKIAKQFKHKIIPAKPALVGLLLSPQSALKNLQGISLLAKLSVKEKIEVTEPLLFTHSGLSGPSIFQISCCWEKGDTLLLNFLPSENALELMNNPANGKLQLKSLFSHFLPDRLVQAILPLPLATRRIAELSKKERLEVFQKIHAFEEVPTGTESFSKAEATKGGVDTLEINPKTMESLLTPKLYFTGEVLDVVGKLGGYNIHWAFASGTAAGKSVLMNEELKMKN